MDNCQHLPQLALRKSLPGKPDNVGFRQIDEPSSGVFAKGHLHCRKFKKKGMIEFDIVHFSLFVVHTL